jgi:S1-C subfamily serine protease
MKRLVIYLLLLVTAMWAYPDVKKVYLDRRMAESIFILTNGVSGGGTAFQLQYGNHQFTVTNSHVCALSKDGFLEVRSPYTDIQRIHILADSPFSDLCLLEPVKELPPLQLGIGNLQVGDGVHVWGHPRLTPLKKTDGKVTQDVHWDTVGLDYIFTHEDAKKCQQPKNLIMPGFFPVCMEHVKAQTASALIQPGSSGSPVFDDKGKVRGVEFAAYATGGRGGDPGDLVPWSSLYIFLMGYTQEVVDLTQ